MTCLPPINIKKRKKGNKGQVTLFIIVAVAIIGLIIGGYFFITTRGKIPTRFQPIEEYYLDCVRLRLEEGTSLLGQRAGYIEVPDFEPGSEEFARQLSIGLSTKTVALSPRRSPLCSTSHSGPARGQNPSFFHLN